MRIAIMFYVLLIVPSCKSDENLLSQVCSIENQNMHSRFFEKYFEVNYLSNLEEAINCSNETSKPKAAYIL